MKKHIVKQSIRVFDLGTSNSPRFTLDGNKEKEAYQTLNLDKGSDYIGADRTELGKWLIANNLLEEVTDGDISST